MTPKPQNLSSGPAGAKRSRLAFLSIALLALLGGEAGAAQKTYKYFRFQPTRIQNDGTRCTMSELTFSLNGTVYNLTAVPAGPGRDGTTNNMVLVNAVFGTQSTGGNRPDRLFDGLPFNSGDSGTRWLSPDLVDPLTTPLDITFANAVTVDSYNFATAGDSSTVPQTPVSWQLSARNSTSAAWELIDVRNNVALNFAGNTYQAGFTIPESITPVINTFGVQNTAAQGTAAIVRNDDANGVKLEWDATLGTATLTPPGTTVPLTGNGFYHPPANATTTYTFNTTLGATSVNKTVQVRSVAGGSSNYRYIRFKATKLRNGTATGLVQISEFGFLNDGQVAGVNSVTNPGGNNPANEGVGNLIDFNNNNKWLDTNNGYVIFDLGVPNPPLDENRFTHYFFVTGNDAIDRDPLQWTLEGSNDETSWTLLENVNFDYPVTTLRNTSTRSIPLPGASLPPSISTFAGDASMIYQGTPFNLSWNVQSAATITINNGVGTVAAQGSTVLNPPVGTTTYTLTASSAGGITTTTRNFTVTVLAGADPGVVNFADFTGSTSFFNLRGPATVVGNRLQLTPDIGSQLGEAWYRVKQPVAQGFEATFGLSMTHTPATQPADGVSFIIQNRPEGDNTATGGETGVAGGKALNLCFVVYGGNAADASRIQLRWRGSDDVDNIQSISASATPGITYKGLTGYAYPTMTGDPGAEPFRIRVVYTPGDGVLTESLVDVYVNEVAVLQDVAVDLGDIGAVDANGKAWVGFAGRTGGLNQLNQITNFRMRYGNFSAPPPFGVVKSFRNTMFPAAPAWDIVWDTADGTHIYYVQSSDNLIDWNDETSQFGTNGQLGYRVPIDAAETHRFYRVKEELSE